MTELLNITSLTKTFENGTVALEGLNLQIEKSKVTTLLGASGCGKSTLLRIVAGLISQSEGELNWDEPPTHSDIGFVFQEPTLLPWATVTDNILLPLSLLRRKAEDSLKRVEAMIALVGLDGFEDAYPRELSGGMKMRVSLARALVTQPRILLMDEPFAALDEITRSKLNIDLLRIQEATNATVLFVTHSVTESVFLSDRVLVMKPRPGRLFEDFHMVHMHDRDAAYRHSADFADKARAVSECLYRAMEAAT